MITRRPIASYFVLTFAISWAAAFAVIAHSLLCGAPVSDTLGILMFPAMLLGPSTSGILMIWLTDGRQGIRQFFLSARRLPVPWKWNGLLLLPPVTLLTVLTTMKTVISPAFRPNHFLLGIAFGIPAGILEEVGWSGFAFPRMRVRFGTLNAGVLLGVLWSAWHLPVIDFLGAARPHGHYLIPFFISFATAMTAIRVLIAWAYANTGSLPLTQLMHISSTAALVIFSPPHATPAQETIWYFAYGGVLWVIVVLIRNVWRQSLVHRPDGVPQIPVER